MLKKGFFIINFFFALGLVGLIILLNNLNQKEMITSIPMSKAENSRPQEIVVSAWYPEWDEKDALASLQTASVKQVLPFWFKLDEEGSLVEIESELRAQVLETSKTGNIEVIPSIFNEFDGTRVNKFLADKENWQTFANTLILKGNEYQLAGFDLDWEELLASDRDNYNEFVGFLAERLKENNLKLAVTVHAQTGEEGDREALKAQDLQTLGLYADEIRVMVYDFHHADSKPGPVTPLAKLKQVIAHTKKLVPEEKIVIGLPTYGYDWSDSGGEPSQYDELLARIEKYKVKPQIDFDNQALIAEYTDEKNIPHTIWFEDAKTVEAKVKIANELGIYKISLWRLGGEDVKTWDIVAKLQND